MKPANVVKAEALLATLREFLSRSDGAPYLTLSSGEQRAEDIAEVLSDLLDDREAWFRDEAVRHSTTEEVESWGHTVYATFTVGQTRVRVFARMAFDYPHEHRLSVERWCGVNGWRPICNASPGEIRLGLKGRMAKDVPAKKRTEILESAVRAAVPHLPFLFSECRDFPDTTLPAGEVARIVSRVMKCASGDPDKALLANFASETLAGCKVNRRG